MQRQTTNSCYWQGVRDGAPFILVIVPFALLFGVVATEAGLNVLETLSFSVLVIAGAAQFTALQLLSDGAPTAIALISALAVNLRMAMYSASLTPYIGGASLRQRALAAYFTVDQSYACAIVKFERNPDWSIPQRLAYFFGVVTPICPLWYLFTLVGAVIGTSIPDGLALDFALPITFLAMIAPMLRTPAHLAAAFVSITLALLLASLPYNLGLLVAGVAGMMTGAQLEVTLERRTAEQMP
ncbi:MAG: branched-chain amino acid transporter AzlC [Rhodobacteraceae bacterium CG17_big_fil_post_rev_8_21_14_2_50_63_15]|nr:branched-chain amino acid ABC transporter permease [Roseovarius sp.]PIV78170.1 MAG: branched-chain amino acid transporter AzlC [Rhodobacteraceae bacterium CG17_big_fil_post_rev_8_21_14_2_50_63_15]